MRYLFLDVQVKGRVICTVYHLQRSVRHLQFKVVYNKRYSIVDMGHLAGWVNRTTECEDATLSGQDWWSEVYIFISIWRFLYRVTMLGLLPGLPLCSLVSRVLW